MTTLSRRRFGIAAGLLGLGALARTAHAQADYPSRPIRLVVPWPPGGSTDSLGRLLAQAMSTILGQSVAVDNRGGGVGTIGHASVATSRPDGYTLLVGTNSTYGIAPHLIANLPYDTQRAFTNLGQIATNAQVLCVHPSVAARNVAELIALAKARPGQLNFSSSGVGGTSHLATELFMSMARIEMTHVPYRGGGPAAQALIAGEVNVTFVDAITASPLMQGGQVRGLGVSTMQRTPILPNVPTINESGLPGFESSTDFALFAPAGLPGPIAQKLHDAMKRALATPELRDKLLQQGIVPVGSSPAEFAAYQQREFEKWGRIIRERNIRVQ